MAQSDFEYRATLDDSDVIKGLKRIEAQTNQTAKSANQKFDGFAKSIGGLALGITGAAAALGGAVAIVNELTDAAKQAQAAQVNLATSAAAANREFGASVGTAESWKETVSGLSDELRIYSEQELTNASTKLVDMSKRLGLTEEQMQTVLRRTADLSAGKTDLNQAITDVTSAIRGEAEASEKYGLSLSEPQVRAYAEAQGLVWKEISETEKYQLRYNLLLDQTNQLQGRAAQYATTLAGAEAALNAELSNQKALLGEQLIPLQQGWIGLQIQALGLTNQEAEDIGLITKILSALAASFITFGATATVVLQAQIEKWSAYAGIIGATWEALKSGQSVTEAIKAQLVAAAEASAKGSNAIASYGETWKTAYKQISEGYSQLAEVTTPAGPGGPTPTTPAVVMPAVDPDEVKKAQERLAELEKDLSRETLDILIDGERKKLDTIADFAQKRLDLAEKNSAEIADIEKDLSRDFEDAARKNARDLVKADQERADKQVDIERDYRRKIQDIRRDFEVSAEDAARNRDAVAFLAAQRKRDEELQSARTDRNTETTDATTDATRRREELALNLEYEREDARIAAERKLEDQRAALQREGENLRQAEAQKSLDLATELTRRLEDSRRHNAEKLADLMASLSAEVQAVLEAEQQKSQIIQQQRDFRNALQNDIDSIRQREASEGRTSLLGGRAYGGPVGAGREYLVGERGPEIFRSNTAGNILPASPSIMSPLLGPNITNTSISNFQPAINQSFSQPTDAITRAIAENAAANIITRLMGLR